MPGGYDSRQTTPTPGQHSAAGARTARTNCATSSLGSRQAGASNTAGGHNDQPPNYWRCGSAKKRDVYSMTESAYTADDVSPVTILLPVGQVRGRRQGTIDWPRRLAPERRS